MLYGDYLKAWGRIEAQRDRIYRQFAHKPTDPNSCVVWENDREPTDGERQALESLSRDKVRLNHDLLCVPAYFDRLQLWRITIFGPCRPDEWTPCPAVSDGSGRSEIVAELEAEITRNKHHEWEPPRDDLRQQAHDFVDAQGWGIGGSGGGLGGWDIALWHMTEARSREVAAALHERFAAEISNGSIRVRRYCNASLPLMLRLEPEA